MKILAAVLVSLGLLGVGSKYHTDKLTEKEQELLELKREAEIVEYELAQKDAQLFSLQSHLDSVVENIQPPLKELVVTGNYGPRSFGGYRYFHKGVDYRANKDSVYAVFDAVVDKVYNGRSQRSGLLLRLRGAYNSNLYVDYMHLHRVNVSPGDTVEAGQLIAVSGNSGDPIGKSTMYAPHLHVALFQSKDKGRSKRHYPIDKFLKQRNLLSNYQPIYKTPDARGV